MPFEWTPLNIGTTISEQINEIKNNLDNICNDIGISPFSWLTLPSEKGEKITFLNISEIRNAVDFIDDNKCPSNNLTEYASDNVDYDNSALASQYTSVDNSLNVSMLSSEDITEFSANNSAINTSQDGTIYTNQNFTNNSVN